MLRKSRSCETDMSEEPASVSRQMTIVVLGSPSSGKTQIIRQFTECNYNEVYRATKTRKTCYTSVGLNERVYQLAILDLPATKRTPKSLPMQEWESRKESEPIDAFVLVFDLTNEDSFGHIRRLRERIESIHVGANSSTNNGTTANGSAGSTGGAPGGSTTVPLVVMGNKYIDIEFLSDLVVVERYDLLFASRGHLSRRYLDIVHTIRKQWKWHYIEVSAKHNWQLQLAFKTLTKLIETQYYGNRMGFGTSERLLPGVLRRNRCIVC